MNMKLNKNFLVYKTGKDTVIVPTANAGFSGVVQGNETLGIIFDLLREDTTEKKIVDTLLEQYDASREEVEKDVAGVITRLKKIGAVDN